MAEQAQTNTRPPASGPGEKKPEKKDFKKDFTKEFKPEEKKEDKGSADERAKRFMAEATLVGIALLFLGNLIARFTPTGEISVQSVLNILYASAIWPYLRAILVTYVTIANLLCLFFVVAISFSLMRVRQIQRKWYAMINPEYRETVIVPEKNERWQRVLEHSASDNPSDWRLAVLEADIILDELLDQEGYVGDTIGDKLKKANPGDFKTLNYAWEAHRIRNAIAHEGQDFILTQREARRILGLYELVFREFNFI